MRYAYFPGCSLERNAAAYDISLRATAESLEIDLVELKDWNCCGATEYFSINLLPAYALVARNLALVEAEFDQVVAPCSACYYNLRKTDKSMTAYPELAAAVNESLAAGNLHYEPGRVHTRHALDLFLEDVSLEEVAAHVQRPLRGLRLAPFYGCIPARPDGIHDPEHPDGMDRLLEALGAEVVDYPVKADCCGGHMTQISSETAYGMLHYLLYNADRAGVDSLVVSCPMCQLNLDAFQGQVNVHKGTDFRIPVLYFTQMMGLAFGIEPEDLAFGQEIVSAAPVLQKLGSPPARVEQPEVRSQPDERALRMPDPFHGGA